MLALLCKNLDYKPQSIEQSIKTMFSFTALPDWLRSLSDKTIPVRTHPPLLKQTTNSSEETLENEEEDSTEEEEGYKR